MRANMANWSVDPNALRGRIAGVAGATRGAGRGIAAALGEAGATVICSGGSSRTRLQPTRNVTGGTSGPSGQLAAEYGFTDIDGSRPDVWRYSQAVESGDHDADPDDYR
jgi:NAD(P)-dependent dehydrogenase (short-subunit alcohol dehydrogenase family)